MTLILAATRLEAAMYTPPAFREDRPDVLRRLIAARPLATLITVDAYSPVANLVPFMLETRPSGDVLKAHLARANDQLPSLLQGGEALVIFQGPQAYVTPSWYATKREHGKVVPTWNYIVVQARGRPQVIEDRDWLSAQIHQLTDAQENARHDPWSVSDAPADYVATQLQRIVGLEIPIRTIEGKWKVSQNQPEANRRGVIDGLRGEGSSDLAEVVEGYSAGGQSLL